MRVREITIGGGGEAVVLTDVDSYAVERDGSWQRGNVPPAATKAQIRKALSTLTKAVAAKPKAKGATK